MANFVRKFQRGGRQEVLDIHNTIQDARVGQPTQFGIYGAASLDFGPNDPNSCAVSDLSADGDLTWFNLTPRRTGNVMVEARERTAARLVWTFFQLQMLTAARASAGHPLTISPAVSPRTFVDWYKNIRVDTEGGVVTVSLNTYRCNLPQFGGLGDALELKDCVVQASRKSGIDPADHAYVSSVTGVDVFYGKGSPWSIARVLSVIDHIARHEESLAAMGRFRSVLERSDRLQYICDTYLGVDCNGFVGHYARYIGVPGADPNLTPGNWRDVGPRYLRSNMMDVRSGDIIIWPGNQHIAIIDRMTSGSGGVFADVCQSTGHGGPQLSERCLVVDRGISTDHERLFYVAPGTGSPVTLPNPALVIKSIGLVLP